MTNERSRLPVPYLYDGVVAPTDNPFFVHAHAPHKSGMSIRVTLEAKHPSLAGYSTMSVGTQNDSVTAGFTHARDRRRHVLFVYTCNELQIGFRGGGFEGRRYCVQFVAGGPAFAGIDVDQSDVVVR